jgi:hypothetical protein
LLSFACTNTGKRGEGGTKKEKKEKKAKKAKKAKKEKKEKKERKEKRKGKGRWGCVFRALTKRLVGNVFFLEDNLIHADGAALSPWW